jgi:hypothetical protein
VHNVQCNAIHRSIVEQFKGAVVYGKSVKHQPQKVGLSHELADEDIGRSASPAMMANNFAYNCSLTSDDHKEMMY